MQNVYAAYAPDQMEQRLCPFLRPFYQVLLHPRCERKGKGQTQDRPPQVERCTHGTHKQQFVMWSEPAPPGPSRKDISREGILVLIVLVLNQFLLLEYTTSAGEGRSRMPGTPQNLGGLDEQKHTCCQVKKHGAQSQMGRRYE